MYLSSTVLKLMSSWIDVNNLCSCFVESCVNGIGSWWWPSATTCEVPLEMRTAILTTGLLYQSSTVTTVYTKRNCIYGTAE
ncbi:hypothetical protein V6N13_028211 [Hibiscus sabdariffa]|uniref:Uncharacterized protein n=1 Tax=Hibiscus sabdariffa TaxID=183260 RepID=A0ABR2DDX3_9ROSI